MAYYYVNTQAQTTGEHEVHKSDCRFLPNTSNRILLGFFPNCTDAIKEAKKHYYNVDGCYFCCNSCHKR